LDTQLLIKEMNKLCDGNTMTGWDYLLQLVYCKVLLFSFNKESEELEEHKTYFAHRISCQ
jgi:hypothetical protein